MHVSYKVFRKAAIKVGREWMLVLFVSSEHACIILDRCGIKLKIDVSSPGIAVKSPMKFEASFHFI